MKEETWEFITFIIGVIITLSSMFIYKYSNDLFISLFIAIFGFFVVSSTYINNSSRILEEKIEELKNGRR